jgi:hypothetical protein
MPRTLRHSVLHTQSDIAKNTTYSASFINFMYVLHEYLNAVEVEVYRLGLLYLAFISCLWLKMAPTAAAAPMARTDRAGIIMAGVWSRRLRPLRYGEEGMSRDTYCEIRRSIKYRSCGQSKTSVKKGLLCT